MARLPFYFLLPALIAAGEERVDLSVVHRIRTEAFENSKVMDILFQITDVRGPRLTNSPGHRQSGEWAVSELKKWGLDNPRMAKWGPFGRGWSYTKFQAHMIEPGYQPIIGFPMAWSPGTGGVIAAEPFFAPMKEEKDLAKYKGKLRGKIVLVDAVRATPLRTSALARRYSDKELDDLVNTLPEPKPKPFDREERNRWQDKRNAFLKEEGALVMVSTGYEGDGGTVFAAAAGSYNEEFADPPPSIAITPEHYNRVVRLLDKKVAVKLQVEFDAAFHTESKDSFNVIAEIPGRAKKDEIVMLGAHFDSWHGGTGATDNGAGSAVMMEAARILKTLDLPMDRTVRLALWSGEENGLLGSKAYVKETFADPAKMVLTAQHGKLAGYFNVDNGGGKIRGVYLQQNDMARPIFDAWLAPFRDLGAKHVTIRKTFGTDHLSFDAVGLPGFQFIQDPMEYSTRTHHSNMDTYDHVVPADLQQAAAIVASCVYHAATRPEKMPRKPLPKPEPPKTEKKKESGE